MRRLAAAPAENAECRRAREIRAPAFRRSGGAGRPGITRAPAPLARTTSTALFELDCRTRLFKLLLDLRRLVLVDAFVDRLRRAFDKILRLFESEPGNGADFLDDVDLLVARGGKDDVELGLLRRRSRGRDGDRGGRRDAPFFLEHLRELGRFDDGERREIVNQFG